MTGTGTQADPFRPTNWDEFVTAVETQDSYVECPEKATWDMNDVTPQGIERTVSVKASNINGNGLTIKNLRNSLPCFKWGFVATQNLHNLNIENTLILNELFTSDFTMNFVVNVSDCIFTGINNGNNLQIFKGYWGSYNRNFKYYRCGFDFDAPLCDLFDGYRIQSTQATLSLYDCNIKYNGRNLTSASSTSRLILSNNCLITGKFNRGTILSTSTIYDCDCVALTTINNIWTMNIVNIDKCPSYPSNTIAVTTEQLKDAPYLRSLGFPIGV